MNDSKNNINASENSEGSQELFQIIDESGEGFGFDLTPDALARPLLLGTASLFGVGMLVGIPFGIAMGRTDEPGKRLSLSSGNTARVKPTLDGVKFAASSFGLGTLLCAAMGLTAFYGIKSYYDVETFEEFGHIMRRTVPDKRAQIELSLSPLLRSVRTSASENLPAPVQRWRDRFGDSKFGRWLKGHIESSVNLVDDNELSNGTEIIEKTSRSHS